jgi:hypothetical protein
VLSEGEVVGWCDVVPKSRLVHADGGVLGVALLPDFREEGLGGRLARRGAGVRAAPGRVDGSGRQRKRDRAA